MKVLKSAKSLFLNIILIVTVIAVFSLISELIRNNQAGEYVLANRRVSAEIEYANGHHSVIEEPDGLHFGKVGIGDTVTLNIRLPSKPLIEDGVLAFTLHSAAVDVSYRGDMLFTYGGDIAQSRGMVGRHYCFTPIPDCVWGDEFSIVLRPTENNVLIDFPSNLYIFEKDMAYTLPLRSQPTSFFISIVLMMLGVFGSISCLFGTIGKYSGKKVLFICLAALLISLWIFCSNGFYVVFGFSDYFWEPLEYIAGFLCAIPLMLFYADVSKEDPKWNRVFRIGSAVMVIANTAVIILNFTNVLHFQRTEIIMYVLIFLCIVLLAVYSFVKRRVGTANKMLLQGIVIFLFTGMIEVLYLIFPPQRIWVYFTNLVSIGVLFLFIYLLIYLFIDFAEKESKVLLLQIRTEKLKTELELSRVRTMIAQMKPHFLYNALASIQEIIYDDPDYASQVVGDFATYLRGAVRAMSDVQLIPFSEELKNIKAYVEIEKVRMGKKLVVEYEIQDDTFDVPTFSIQPLVENAIRHGIYERGVVGGKVMIRSYDTEENHIIQVVDNGIGFDVAAISKEVEEGKRDSVGMKNLMSRLNIVLQATVDIQSTIGIGTTVTVTIPRNRGEKE